MSFARFNRFERLFDRIAPVVLIAMSIGLAGATLAVGA
jgi:hypothetical protein